MSQSDEIPRDRQMEVLGRFFGLEAQEFKEWAIVQPDANLIGKFLLGTFRSGPLRQRTSPGNLLERE